MWQAAQNQTPARRGAQTGAGCMKAILPSAGYAVRLYPLTKDKPKALIEVKDKPIITHIVAKIEELPGIDEILVVTNNKFFYQFEDWAANTSSSMPLSVISDHTMSNDDRLGQIGDIRLAIEEGKAEGDVLIISSDNLFNFSLMPMYEMFMEKKASVIALYDVGSVEEAKKMGVVGIDGQGKVIAFEEKPEKPKSTLCSCGIYFYPAGIIPLFAKYTKEGNDPDRMGNFLEWLIKRETVYGHVFREKWFDIGSFESLGKAREEFDA